MLDILGLSPEQREQVAALQADIDARLKELLNDEQERQFEELRAGGGFGGVAQPGQIFSPFQQARLNLSDEQRPQLEALQKTADDRLAEILNEQQRAQLSQAGAGPGGLAGAGGRRGGPDGPDGRRQARGGGGRGGRGGGGGPGGGSIFRVYRYAADYPGLAGKDLTPGRSLEEVARGGGQ
jgi:hypothetical protein